MCDICRQKFATHDEARNHISVLHPMTFAKIITMSSGKRTTRKKSVKEQISQNVTSRFTVESDSADESKTTEPSVIYSCCHCNSKGIYSFLEEHVKAQHRDLPFLLRKEEESKLYLEVYQYACGHCSVKSSSLMEAMDHWVKNHVTLDFKFNLTLQSSSLIKEETSEEAASNKLNTSDAESSSKSFSSPSNFTATGLLELPPVIQVTPKAEKDSENESVFSDQDINASFSSSDFFNQSSDIEMDSQSTSHSVLPTPPSSNFALSQDSDESFSFCLYPNCGKRYKRLQDLKRHMSMVCIS